MSEDIAGDVAALRVWAEGSVRHGERAHPFAAQLLRVLAFLDDQSRLTVALAERCRAQAELLAKRAEREGGA